MHEVDFNALPRASRERFVHALEALPPVGPICSRATPPPSALVWYALGLLAVAGLVGLALIGFGGIGTPVQDRRYLSGYVFGCGVLGLALAMLGRQRALARELPFQAGVYVFGQDLVDARSRVLELHPLTELLSVDAVHQTAQGIYSHSTLWLVFPAQTYTFELRGRHQAEERGALITNARQSLGIALERGDQSALSAYDPFAEARAYGFQPVAVAEGGPLATPVPIWVNFIWAVGLVSAFLLGVAAWRGRNMASDARAFATLTAKPDPHAVLLYLSAGGLRADALKASVLPRARFSDAMKEAPAKRAEALDRFLKDYPRSEVDAEARAALVEAVHAEFVACKTAAEVRGFIARWPTAADLPAAKLALHGIHDGVLAAVRQHGSGADRNVLPVLEALFAWEEAHGEPVLVRFRRRDAHALTTTDKLLAKGLLDDDGPAAAGNADVARHFAPDQIDGREAAFVEGLARAFRGAFPEDVMPLAIGAPIADDDADRALERPLPRGEEGRRSKASGAGVEVARGARAVPDAPSPILVVDYRVGWNGLTYLARDRKRRFVGVFVKCELALAVPSASAGRALTLAFPLKVDTPETLAVDASDAGADDDRSVYDALVVRAFELGAGRLAGVFFDAKTAAARTPEPP